jgi:DNA-binding NtrC family response regulator
MRSEPPRLLLADDQPDVLEALRLLLKPEGYAIETAASPQQILRALETKDFDVVVMDLNYARDTTSGVEGLDLLQRIHTADESLPVVVMTAWGSVNVAVEAMRRGARDFVQKPWDNERLLSIIRTQTELGRALRRGRQLEAANQALQADGHNAILAESAAMRPVLEMIARVGPSDANVLISGENGTGKSLVAQALHAVSPRAGRPMVTVNAGGMAEGVFESELFGHLKGSFTDAKADRVGRFELADGSTLFLDEIANVPLTQQQKLLRVIETGEFERLGSSKTRRVNVRPRSPRVHPAAGHALHAPARAALSQAPVLLRPGGDAAAAGSPLAGQRARARSRRRARGAHDRRQHGADAGSRAAG